MKKTKAKDIDLFYIAEDEKKKKNNKKAGKNKPASKSKDKKKTENDDVFRFDEEIVIGITKKEDMPKKKEKKQKTKKENISKKVKDKKAQKQIISKKVQKENVKKTISQNKGQKLIPKKKNKKIVSILKYSFLFILLICSIIYFMLSPVFNIKQITVNNNQKVLTDEIISLSGIILEDNIFKVRLGHIEKNIKENAYIDSVEVKRKLPSNIEIEVVERVATYMLEFVNGFVYINNQGYILEITENKSELPIITGYETMAEEIKEGNRLCKEDLQKLEMVLKIMKTASNYEVDKLITKIEIADKNNYTLFLEEELKTVFLGDASNIDKRIQYLKGIIENEKGIESEVFINGDVNKDDVYTREKV